MPGEVRLAAGRFPQHGRVLPALGILQTDFRRFSGNALRWIFVERRRGVGDCRQRYQCQCECEMGFHAGTRDVESAYRFGGIFSNGSAWPISAVRYSIAVCKSGNARLVMQTWQTLGT